MMTTAEPPGWRAAAGTGLDRTPILAYHAVSADPPGWIAPFAVTPAMFAAHLDVIAASGRQALTISQYADALRGAAPPPGPAVLITADDGFADFAEQALPALTARGMRSTLYVTTGALADRPRDTVLPAAAMLRGRDLAGLAAAGVEIGAHSHTHRQLDLLGDEAVTAELARSRDVVADCLGQPARSFAYPHGYWRRRMLRLVRAAGYDSAAAVGNALSVPADRLLALPRLLVMADTDPAALRGWLDGSQAHPGRRLRRVAAFGWRQYRRWTGPRA